MTLKSISRHSPDKNQVRIHPTRHEKCHRSLYHNWVNPHLSLPRVYAPPETVLDQQQQKTNINHRRWLCCLSLLTAVVEALLTCIYPASIRRDVSFSHFLPQPISIDRTYERHETTSAITGGFRLYGKLSLSNTSTATAIAIARQPSICATTTTQHYHRQSSQPAPPPAHNTSPSTPSTTLPSQPPQPSHRKPPHLLPARLFKC